MVHATSEPGAGTEVVGGAVVSGGCGSGCDAAMVVVERAAMRPSTCCSVDCMLLSTTVWTARRIVAILGVTVELVLVAAGVDARIEVDDAGPDVVAMTVSLVEGSLRYDNNQLLSKVLNCLFEFCRRASLASNSCTEGPPPAGAIICLTAHARAKTAPWHTPTI